MRRFITTHFLGVIAFALAAVVPRTADAGCGCDKPPPVVASVRPHATYAGTDVVLFHPDFQPREKYEVVFTSGTTGETATVKSAAVMRADLADGRDKPQVVVSLPDLPLGPTAISVGGRDGVLLYLDDAAFTVVPRPVVVPEQAGFTEVAGFRAAVGRDGAVYLSLDMSNVSLPRVFRAQAQGYPLRFTEDDVVFYNTQGFLMQLLDGGIPGLFSLAAAGKSGDSDLLQYSRHEFSTFYLQHAERQPHDVAADDPNWHLDGTPHIDHDHLVLAIAGSVDGGARPLPGATPPFALVLSTYSLFHRGVVGETSVHVGDVAMTDSYDSSCGVKATNGETHVCWQGSVPHGDVHSNGLVRLTKNGIISGDAHASAYDISGNGIIVGEACLGGPPVELMPVSIPSAAEDIGSLVVTGRQANLTLRGPASYRLSELIITDNGRVFVDNSAGPVTFYVTGEVKISRNGMIIVSDQDPEKFAIYAAGSGPVTFEGNAIFYGVVYGPDSPVSVAGRAEFFGAVVGKDVALRDQSLLYYDTALRGGHVTVPDEPIKGNKGGQGSGQK